MSMFSDSLNKKSVIKRKIRVGLTEKHGMVKEYSVNPPDNVDYSFLNPLKGSSLFLRSPIKGYFRSYESSEHDLIEATLSPIFTNNKWIYSVANFQEAMSFNFCGFPLPRLVRSYYIKNIILKENFKKLIFWSEYGKKTLSTYGNIKDHRVTDKCIVVYPAIRKISDCFIRFNENNINLLFSGDFFRKGGANVIDAFKYISDIYSNVNLFICCDEKLDFNTENYSLKKEYIEKIKTNKNINLLGRVDRDDMVNNILPKMDIYLLPTYAEAFGYAVIEAMAYGIPVITTKISAIPEMIEHEKSGFLIDISAYNHEKLFKGYVVKYIPNDFKEYVTKQLISYLVDLIGSISLRKKIGYNGLASARSKFSFEVRNEIFGNIYNEIV